MSAWKFRTLSEVHFQEDTVGLEIIQCGDLVLGHFGRVHICGLHRQRDAGLLLQLRAAVASLSPVERIIHVQWTIVRVVSILGELHLLKCNNGGITSNQSKRSRMGMA